MRIWFLTYSDFSQDEVMFFREFFTDPAKMMEKRCSYLQESKSDKSDFYLDKNIYAVDVRCTSSLLIRLNDMNDPEKLKNMIVDRENIPKAALRHCKSCHQKTCQ